MSKSNQLNAEQKSLLELSEIGDFFEIVVNYQTTSPVTKELEHKRITAGLTIVPETEAQFEDGYEKLVAYFEDNIHEEYKGGELNDFNAIGIKFIINKDGLSDEIKLFNRSKYPHLDSSMMALVKHMPAWIPAKDANGNIVKQNFELILGTPGC